jgi:hypothetical protein
MRTIGFSTGALAYGDFRHGLSMMTGRSGVDAIELSALRQNEIAPLLNALPSLDLSDFSYISIHIPSQIEAASEKTIWLSLRDQVWRGWPFVVHPDAIHDFGLWRDLGSSVLIENMDKRKPIGRTVNELARVFKELPEARLCFDIGHARQVDSTMTEAYMILRDFGSRLRQVHVSEVNTSSKHDPLSLASILAFQEVANLIPSDVPLILETPVTVDQMEREMDKVRQALPLNLQAKVA